MVVSRCRGVTAGGYRIEFDAQRTGDSRGEALRLPLSPLREQWTREKAASGYVMVSVNPFDQQPHGQPDPAELPLRYPHSQPTYALSVLTDALLPTSPTGATALPVARLRFAEGRFWLDDDYVPPCRETGAWGALRAYHGQLGGRLDKLTTSTAAVVNRVRSQARTAQANLLAASIGFLAEGLLRVLGDQLDRYTRYGLEEPPRQMVDLAVQLARTFRIAILCTPDAERDTMFNYFKNWCNIAPADLQTGIDHLLLTEYHHADARPALLAVDRCVDRLVELFAKLSELNYVEKNRETIYKEREEVTQEPPRRNRIWG